jgi:hypothetical protein
MTVGLTLPFVTEPDPDRAGEGSLDPLGLARLAERLADEVAAEVTARMSRIRFLTAIAVSSHILMEPADLVGPLPRCSRSRTVRMAECELPAGRSAANRPPVPRGPAA